MSEEDNIVVMLPSSAVLRRFPGAEDDENDPERIEVEGVGLLEIDMEHGAHLLARHHAGVFFDDTPSEPLFHIGDGACDPLCAEWVADERLTALSREPSLKHVETASLVLTLADTWLPSWQAKSKTEPDRLIGEIRHASSRESAMHGYDHRGRGWYCYMEDPADTLGPFSTPQQAFSEMEMLLERRTKRFLAGCLKHRREIEEHFGLYELDEDAAD